MTKTSAAANRSYTGSMGRGQSKRDSFSGLFGDRRGAGDYLETRQRAMADVASWLESSPDPKAMDESVVISPEFWSAYDAIVEQDFAGRKDEVGEADSLSFQICRRTLRLREVSDLQTATRGACRALLLADALDPEIKSRLLAPLNALRAQDGLPLIVA